jgi:hypothetical protein
VVSFKPRLLYLQETALADRLIGGWIDPEAGLDSFGEVRRNSGATPPLPLYAFMLFVHGSTAPVGLGLLVVEASQSHLGRHTRLGGTSLDE